MPKEQGYLEFSAQSPADGTRVLSLNERIANHFEELMSVLWQARPVCKTQPIALVYLIRAASVQVG
jgi:hypothetical protein